MSDPQVLALVFGGVGFAAGAMWQRALRLREREDWKRALEESYQRSVASVEVALGLRRVLGPAKPFTVIPGGKS